MAALSASHGEHPISKLLERAQAALDGGEPEAAVLFLRKASDNPQAESSVFDLLAEVEMSIGETDRAARAWLHTIEQSGNPDDPAHAERYLYLGQLQEGTQSRDSHVRGITLLESRVRSCETTSCTPSNEESNPEVIKGQLCRACCALAELYLTDLCFEDSAERHCQEAFDKAMQYNLADTYEPFLGLASLRLSQEMAGEASQLAISAYERLSKATADSSSVESGQRLAAAKVLLECAPTASPCADAALDLLSNLMREDDENAEIWFLMGVGFFQQSPPDTALSRDYLLRGAELLEKARESSGGIGFESELQLLSDQLSLLDEYVREHGEDTEENEVDEGEGSEDDMEN